LTTKVRKIFFFFGWPLDRVRPNFALRVPPGGLMRMGNAASARLGGTGRGQSAGQPFTWPPVPGQWPAVHRLSW